jgi:hypothetical protein
MRAVHVSRTAVLGATRRSVAPRSPDPCHRPRGRRAIDAPGVGQASAAFDGSTPIVAGRTLPRSTRRRRVVSHRLRGRAATPWPGEARPAGSRIAWNWVGSRHGRGTRADGPAPPATLSPSTPIPRPASGDRLARRRVLSRPAGGRPTQRRLPQMTAKRAKTRLAVVALVRNDGSRRAAARAADVQPRRHLREPGHAPV